MSGPAPAVHPLLAARRSLSRFSEGREVPRGHLLALLEAARWAPSSGNEQPWRFLVVPRGHPRRAPVEEALRPGNTFAGRAPLLIVAAARLAREKGGGVDPNPWAEHDTGIATGFLLVQASALGLAAHPMGGWSAEALRAALEISPELRPTTVIAVGWHDPELRDERLEERESRPRARKPLGEIASFGAPGEEPVG